MIKNSGWKRVQRGTSLRRLTGPNLPLVASHLVHLAPLLVLHLSVKTIKTDRRQRHFLLVPPLHLHPILLGNQQRRRTTKTTVSIPSEQTPRPRVVLHSARKLRSLLRPFQGQHPVASHLVNHSQQHRRKLHRLFHSVPPP